VARRDELRAHLRTRGVETAIHYPIPIHLQPASAKLGYRAGDFPIAEQQSERILTLPINQTLTPEDVRYVADMVNEFFKS
jgi:dTDP-4-amino-4,6-dideoxygalactose transaminase